MLHPVHWLKTLGMISLLVLFSVGIVEALVDVNQSGTVTTVYDGSSFGLSSGATVRLASVDTPPAGQPGYNEAKNYLTNLIQGKSVYLDVSNSTNVGSQGTLVSVVFIDYNASFYENINMAMLVSNYGVPNSTLGGEFSPSSWSLLESNQIPTASPFSSPSPTVSATIPASFVPTPPLSPPSVPEIPALLVSLIIFLVSSLLVKTKRKK